MAPRLLQLLLVVGTLAAAWWVYVLPPAEPGLASAQSPAPPVLPGPAAQAPAPEVLEPAPFIARMEAHQRAGDLAAVADGRRQILAEAARLQAQPGGAASAVALLEQWLDRFPRDLALWQALSDHLQQAGRQQAAVDALLAALQTTQQPEEQAPMRDRLRLLVEALASQQRSQGAPANVAALYAHLMANDPLHLPWRVAAIRSAARAGDREAAAEHLALLPEWELDDATWAELLALAAPPELATLELPAGSVRVLERGRQPLVPVVVAGRRLRLLVDTGATMTTLKADSVQGLLGLRDLGERVRMRTVGGDRTGTLVEAAQVVLGGRPLGPRTMAVLVMDGMPGSDGLLGMDVLGGYGLQRHEGVLWLVPATN